MYSIYVVGMHYFILCLMYITSIPEQNTTNSMPRAEQIFATESLVIPAVVIVVLAVTSVIIVYFYFKKKKGKASDITL